MFVPIRQLKNCDKIYRFDNGKIVDEGTFDKFKVQN
jgi:ABC-type multidrug transport system fused ATPase/permease subunit